MERLHVTFLFAVGQPVYWLQPHGPRYVVLTCAHVKGPWPAGYTAGVPQAMDEGPRNLYLLAPEHNILGTFWAQEKDLYRI